MATYMIGYCADPTNQECDDLDEVIHGLTDRCWHNLDRTWIIDHCGTATSIRNALKPHVDADAGLVVVKVSSEDAWAGYDGSGVH